MVNMLKSGKPILPTPAPTPTPTPPPPTHDIKTAGDTEQYVSDLACNYLAAGNPYANPAFQASFTNRDIFVDIFHQMKLSFCSGLLTVLTAESPPPPSWFRVSDTNIVAHLFNL